MSFNIGKDLSIITHNFPISQSPNFPISQFQNLVPPHVLPFHIIHEGLIDDLISPGGGIVAGKIPVAQVAGTGAMQVFNALEDNIHGNVQAGRCYELSDLR